MSGIKLKAKRKNTDDWLLFGITELFHGENGYFQVCVEDVGLFAIDPATIEPADDPRKAMLDEIRESSKAMLKEIRESIYKYSYADWHRMLMGILGEMEAKL